MSYETIRSSDASYPRLLKEIHAPPAVLYARGRICADEPAIAIVGTRKPSAYGIEAAKMFSRELAGRGFVIVSGLAFGIDKAAHEACLAINRRTIAVLASGIDEITPRSHEQLGRAIIKQQGAIVSEFPPGTPSRPEQFPQRNRIISGLSLGIVVIEAPETSGALITARFAAEQGRDVFVVPGSVFSPNFHGSHSLIQEGAALVSAPEEVIEALGYETPQLAFAQTAAPDNLKPQAKTILNLLSQKDGVTMDELSRSTNLSMQELNAHLTFLEMTRYIRKENEKVYINKMRN